MTCTEEILAEAILDKLNDYEGAAWAGELEGDYDIWADVVRGLSGYDAAATIRHPECLGNIIVFRDGTEVRWDGSRGLWGVE